MSAKITITIRGQGGQGATDIDAQAWSYASPVQRVLLLHKYLHRVTKGQPFEIISQIKGN